MKVGEALSARGLTPEDAERLLAEAGVSIHKGARKGAAISANDIKKRTGGELSPRWAVAFGIDTEDPPPIAEAGDGGSGAREPVGSPRGRAHEKPPQRPAGAKVEPVALPAGSGKRIAGLYRGGGAILAMQVRRTHGENAGQGVAKVFSDKADPIADLWMQAAAENPTVARFVETINGGGVTGDLVLAHVVLAASLIYILGAPLPDAAFANYSRYRVVVQPKPEPGGIDADPDGAVPAGAGSNGAARVTSTAPLG